MTESWLNLILSWSGSVSCSGDLATLCVQRSPHLCTFQSFIYQAVCQSLSCTALHQKIDAHLRSRNSGLGTHVLRSCMRVILSLQLAGFGEKYNNQSHFWVSYACTEHCIHKHFKALRPHYGYKMVIHFFGKR